MSANVSCCTGCTTETHPGGTPADLEKQAHPEGLSRFSDALNDSANELSALVPIAPIDWVTPNYSHNLRYCSEV